jgi:hypothetical protein
MKKRVAAFLLAPWLVCADESAGGARTFAASVPPPAYTNHAGHAVSGRVEAVTNGFAVISGRPYPLSVFPETEQARIRAAHLAGESRSDATAAAPPLPVELEAKRQRLRERYLRNEALLKAGLKTQEAAAEQRARLLVFWRRTLDAAPGLAPAVRDWWSTRLAE